MLTKWNIWATYMLTFHGDINLCYFEVGTGRGYLLFLDNEYYFGRMDIMDMMTKQGFAFLQSHNRILPVVDFKPDIIHCNDWQTGVLVYS